MSDNEHITVRIVDIARMAGVSVATVDRVIHNRGKVSRRTSRASMRCCGGSTTVPT